MSSAAGHVAVPLQACLKVEVTQEWQPLTADHRELLLGFRKGHTHVGRLKGKEKDRCSLLRKAPHVSSLVLILLCLLQASVATTPARSLEVALGPDVVTYCNNLPAPMQEAVGPFRSLLVGPRHSIHMLLHECAAQGVSFDPAPDLSEHDLRGLGAAAATWFATSHSLGLHGVRTCPIGAAPCDAARTSIRHCTPPCL